MPLYISTQLFSHGLEQSLADLGLRHRAAALAGAATWPGGGQQLITKGRTAMGIVVYGADGRTTARVIQRAKPFPVGAVSGESKCPLLLSLPGFERGPAILESRHGHRHTTATPGQMMGLKLYPAKTMSKKDTRYSYIW